MRNPEDWSKELLVGVEKLEVELCKKANEVKMEGVRVEEIGVAEVGIDGAELVDMVE